MNWQKYIHQHAADLHVTFGENEANVILIRLAEYIGCNDYSAIKYTEVSSKEIEKADKMLAILKQGKPIQYILEEAWFYKYPFKVNESVLIPRPETEELVEWALSCITNLPFKKTPLSLLDIGTGSGCIPITIKKECPEVNVTTLDISREALRTAQENASLLHTDIEFMELDFLDERSWKYLKEYDIIISNPPYIPMNEKERLSLHVRNYEPQQALFVPDNNPLVFYRKIAAFGKSHLRSHGVIFLELHQDFAEKTKKLFEEEDYKNVNIKKDISGNSRMLKVGK